jgi:putative hemolysin
MPKEFTDCVKKGGRVVTKKLKGNKYIKICYDKDGNSHAGEVKTKKKSEKSEKSKIENSKQLARKLLQLQKHFNNKRV